MTNQEAIRILESMKDELIIAFDHDRKEALKLAISTLQAQYSIRICDTCKHDPPEMDKWPCMDCDMREPADRWEAKDVPDTNVGDMINRRFVEVLAEYHDPEICPYKEYKGKPYFSIKYIENGEEYIGYGTYSSKVMSQYLRKYFMIPAQPDNQVHLCESCRYTYPDCPSKDSGVIFGNGKGNDNICACNRYLPSAQPEQRWIPCSERLPEDVEIFEEYPLVIFCTKDNVYTGYYEYYLDGRWWAAEDYIVDNVIAWMPLPESYKEEE